MGLLESLEALICFIYAAWCQDHYNRDENSWESIPGYLEWCKSRWLGQVGSRDNVREKSFLGLIHMIEAFMRQRLVRYRLSSFLELRTKEYFYEIERVTKAKQAAAEASSAKPKPTPPEKSLPSPDTDAASANSTPVNPGNTPLNTPFNANDSRSEDAKRGINKMASTRPPESNAPPEVFVPVKQSYIVNTRTLLNLQSMASREMRQSEKLLSLAIMREHFPHTFGRMVCSTLSADEEYEPDMEDGEGELFWPSQCVTGDGIAWVCLMGRAMVREFGKEIGYTSLSGAIPKPTSS